jgi:predicted Rossmann fold nucleotide-binding protein DprA/Smf involved in DNA uptake
MSRVGVVGSRDFNDYPLMRSTLNTMKISHIVSGGSRGADSLAEQYANEKKIPFTVYPARWELYGKSAGVIRNRLIVDNSDMIIAFWDGTSPGTRNTIEYARSVDKKVIIIDMN